MLGPDLIACQKRKNRKSKLKCWLGVIKLGYLTMQILERKLWENIWLMVKRRSKHCPVRHWKLAEFIALILSHLCRKYEAARTQLAIDNPLNEESLFFTLHINSTSFTLLPFYLTKFPAPNSHSCYHFIRKFM